MKTSSRILANRRNSQASTGPRTSAGKARVAMNALRHGLNVPVALDPGLSRLIERLSTLIAGDARDSELLQAARLIAEAQIDLLRVRCARLALLSDPKARLKSLNSREMRKAAWAMMAWSDFTGSDPYETLEAVDRLVEMQRPDGEPTLAEAFDVLTPQLERLERYERRALSRRKSAIRAYDLLIAQSKPKLSI